MTLPRIAIAVAVLVVAAGWLSGCSSSVSGTAIAPAEATSIAPFPPAATPGQEPPDVLDQIRARGVTGTDDEIRTDMMQVCVTSAMYPRAVPEDLLAQTLSDPPGTLSVHDAKVITEAAMLYVCPAIKAQMGR